MREAASVEGAAAPVGATTLANELLRLDQALADLRACRVSEVCLLRCDAPELVDIAADRLTRRARKNSFLSAEVSLADSTLESLDDVLRLLLEELAPPTKSGNTSRRGLLTLLDFFIQRHGDEALTLFDERAAEYGAADDLTALARHYVETGGSKSALREYTAWRNGTELSRKSRRPIARAALSAKTAKKTLTDLTRLVRVFGFSGCYFFFRDGDMLARRPERRRQKAYTVLRELVDNFDTGRGAISTRFVICGGEALFEGERSLHSLAPLYMRLQLPGTATPAPPHRSWAHVVDVTTPPRGGETERVKPHRRKELAAMIRISQGLPPLEGVASLSVKHEKIDDLVTKLFEHAQLEGSVFQVLTGEYGSGKTHLLMHLAERAHDQGHPVFRLNLEQLDFDLGNPQRHFWRLLRDSSLPLRHRPSALDRLDVWTRTPAKLGALRAALEGIAATESEAAQAATSALKMFETRDPAAAVASFLAGRNLSRKPSRPAVRRAAYTRLLLWLELLSRLEDCRGPILMIDEAENLYTTHASHTARRTALRSLAFYCGGTLPSACVILAITPKVFGQLKRDSRELLAEVGEQSTALEWEDAEMLRRRLFRLTPEPVPEFKRADRVELAERLMTTHRHVRGKVDTDAFAREMKALLRTEATPRELLRSLTDLLEHAWWNERSGR